MAEAFGTLPSGEVVQRVIIGDDNLTISVLTYGATMQSVRLADVPYSLCLGFENLDGYLNGGAHMGAIVGRVANRIGNGRASIDGTVHEFDRNEGGRHTLHGGSGGLSLQNWTLGEVTGRSVDLAATESSGSQGFPGQLEVTARYAVLEGGVLEISLEATSDAPTLCNLAPHPYFNLNGDGDAREQLLRIASAAVTATDDEKIPTGELLTAFGTTWDHRTEKPMLATGFSYDHNFCLSYEREPIRNVARLTGARGGISMQIDTTEPGLQVYDGAGLATPYSGIALEPQSWPDAPNHSHFPGIDLLPGEVLRQVTRFTFERV